MVNWSPWLWCKSRDNCKLVWWRLENGLFWCKLRNNCKEPLRIEWSACHNKPSGQSWSVTIISNPANVTVALALLAVTFRQTAGRGIFTFCTTAWSPRGLNSTGYNQIQMDGEARSYFAPLHTPKRDAVIGYREKTSISWLRTNINRYKAYMSYL